MRHNSHTPATMAATMLSNRTVSYRVEPDIKPDTEAGIKPDTEAGIIQTVISRANHMTSAPASARTPRPK